MTQPVVSAPIPISSSSIAAIVKPVFDAYRNVVADHAALAPPTTDTQRLIRLAAVDQAGRDALAKIDFSKLTVAEKDKVWSALWAEITPHDAYNLAALRKMMPVAGWFTIRLYGKDAAKAAFLIVQHADSLVFQKDVLDRMRPLLGSADLDGQFYGLLWDRVALKEGQKQRYGTQVFCEQGVYKAVDLEDPEHVDIRRKEAGFKQTER